MPPTSRCAMCFTAGPADPGRVVDSLEHDFRVVASLSPYNERYVRFMKSMVNSADEIDEAVLAVRAVVGA